MLKLDNLLEFLEDRIDIRHQEEVEKNHLDSLDFKKVLHLPLIIYYANDKLSDDKLMPFPYSEAHKDPEKMLYNELVAGIGSIYNSVILKDHLPFHIRSNHGLGIISSLFGASCKIIYDNMPWVEHLKSIEEIKKVISRGAPNIDSKLSKKVTETYQYFNYKLKQYPKCYKAIKISQPDMQSPFDNAHLLCGANIFLYLYDYPDVMHALLDTITTAYIDYRKYIESYLTDKAGNGCMYVHGAIYKGRVIIKDDTAMVSLSEDMYREFVKPYNERILKEFGKGSIHYCGGSKEWHIRNIIDQQFSSANYGNPEMHDISKIYASFKEHRISIIGWGESLYYYDAVKGFLENDINTGISLIVKADDYEDACRVLEKHLA